MAAINFDAAGFAKGIFAFDPNQQIREPMKIYVLNSNASGYFGFVKNDSTNILVSSICADLVFGTHEKEEFGRLASNGIKNLLKSEPLKKYKAYAIFNKAIYNLPTRTEAYKRIWKDPLVKPYIDQLETKDEITTKYDDFYLFSGISRLNYLDEIDLFSILDMLGFRNLLFLSKYDLNDIYKEFKNIQKAAFSGSSNVPEVNFDALFKEYCREGNVLIRFGTDFTNMEVSAVYNAEDFPNKLSFQMTTKENF